MDDDDIEKIITSLQLVCSAIFSVLACEITLSGLPCCKECSCRTLFCPRKFSEDSKDTFSHLIHPIESFHQKLGLRVSVAHPDMSTPAELTAQPKIQLQRAQAELVRSVGDVLLDHLDSEAGVFLEKESRKTTESDGQSCEDARSVLAPGRKSRLGEPQESGATHH